MKINRDHSISNAARTNIGLHARNTGISLQLTSNVDHGSTFLDRQRSPQGTRSQQERDLPHKARPKKISTQSFITAN